MILASQAEFRRFLGLNPRFPQVAEFLDRPDLASLPEGRLDLDGDDLFVISVPEARTRPVSEALLEAHRTYIDVQVVLEGVDVAAWAPLESCHQVEMAYDPGKDVSLFRDVPVSHVAIHAGCLAIFFPEDAHAPLIGAGETVRKVIFKVRVG
jgi:biofilm protein TabA